MSHLNFLDNSKAIAMFQIDACLQNNFKFFSSLSQIMSLPFLDILLLQIGSYSFVEVSMFALAQI